MCVFWTHALSLRLPTPRLPPAPLEPCPWALPLSWGATFAVGVLLSSSGLLVVGCYFCSWVLLLSSGATFVVGCGFSRRVLLLSSSATFVVRCYFCCRVLAYPLGETMTCALVRWGGVGGGGCATRRRHRISPGPSPIAPRDEITPNRHMWVLSALYFGPETGSRRGGRGFKRFLEAVGFVLAKFEPKPSHGDPIRDQKYGFGTYDMCWNIYKWHACPGSNTTHEQRYNARTKGISELLFECGRYG